MIQIYNTEEGVCMKRLEEKNNRPLVINVIGGQINIALGDGRIEATQSNPVQIPKIIIIKDKFEKNAGTNVANSSSGLGDEGLLLAIICALFLTKWYMDYMLEVQMGIIIVSALIELITIFTYCNGKKAGIIYGENIKRISLFNMISIIIVPMIIGMINSRVYTSKIRLDLFVEKINNKGIWVAFFNSEYAYYALCQMIGILALIAFLVCIVVSDIYIVSIINIVENRKGQWFWKFLLGLLHRGNDNWKKHMYIGSFFIAVSVLFAGGVLPFVINWCTN